MGALAVLYDVTDYFPGAPKGLSPDEWNDLPRKLLSSQSIPLNLQNSSAAFPSSLQRFSKATEAGYGAVVGNPFLADTDLYVDNLPHLRFLARHYFDVNSSPTFDLMSSSGLFASVAKAGDVAAPAGSDPGLLLTGAVDWLRLNDNGKGLGKGVSSVYRVVTAGGKSESCSTIGALSGSVPYTAFYMFYGPPSPSLFTERLLSLGHVTNTPHVRIKGKLSSVED